MFRDEWFCRLGRLYDLRRRDSMAVALLRCWRDVNERGFRTRRMGRDGGGVQGLVVRLDLGNEEIERVVFGIELEKKDRNGARIDWGRIGRERERGEDGRGWDWWRRWHA